MFVLLFADTVELEIDTVLARSFRGFAELDVFSETNSVGGREDAIETDLLRVSYCLKIVGRQCRFAAGEQNNDLSFRLERNSAIQNRLCIFKRRLVHIANLVGIHE